MARTKNLAEVIKKKLATDPALADAVAEAGFQAGVADQIYSARVEAGLTQAELARRIDSQQSVIARMEDADYESHSISMLTRIGNALGKDLQIVFKDKPYAGKSAPPKRNAAKRKPARAKAPARRPVSSKKKR